MDGMTCISWCIVLTGLISMFVLYSQVYMMTWVERKVATSLVSNFPSTTIDEALVAFQSAEALKPDFWIDNQLHMAKVGTH